MRLGGSLRRSRGGGGGPRRAGGGGRTGKRRASRKGQAPRRWWRPAALAAALAAVGWAGGYALATRVLFPAPPPPADLVTVPDVRGTTVASAATLLGGAGLTLGAVDSLQHPSVGRDLILGQAPLPGQLAQPGAGVRVTVSLESPRRPLPDVVGVELSRARLVLETMGFVVDVDSVDSDLPRGRVVSTGPAAGAPVAVPSQVRLAVSRGPGRVAMPYLVGLDEVRAMAVLDSLGLVVGAVEYVAGREEDDGLVVAHEPAADTPLERGSAVRLAVGRRGG